MDFEHPPKTQNQPVAARGTKQAKVKKRIRTHRCAFCAMTFCGVTPLEVHIRSHTGEKPFLCPELNCPFAASQSPMIKTHVNSNHIQRNPFPCSLCSASFKKSHNLKRHLATHKEMPTSSSASSASNAKKAPEVSFQEKPPLPAKAKVPRSNPVKISLLNKRDPTKFQTKLTLSTQYSKDHLCICPTCGFALPNKTIVSHRRFHEGTGTHTCVICRVSYNDRSSLSCHLKSRLHVMRMGLGGTKGVSQISQSQTRVKGAHLNEFRGTSSSQTERCQTSMPKLTESKLWTELPVTTGEKSNEFPVKSESAQRTKFTSNPALKRMRSPEDQEEIDSLLLVSKTDSRITWSRDGNHNLVGTQFCGRLKICGVRYNRKV